MESPNFEKHMQAQLKKREIRPSAGSWEKLRIRLESEQPEKRSILPWIGVAAAIAIVFFILGAMWQTPVDQAPPVIVEETPVDQTPPVMVEETPVIDSASQAPGQVQSVHRIAAGEKLPPEAPRKAVSTSEARVQDQIARLGTMEAAGTESEKIRIVGAGTPLTSSASHESDAEIDRLLDIAMSEISPPQDVEYMPISAEALLDEVEYELDQTFRQKVFEVLKEGFSKAKTAVANRNH